MNKEILLANIMGVINSPRWAKYPTRIIEKGISKDGKEVCIQCTPTDSSDTIYLDKDIVEQIFKYMPEEYSEHLVTIKPDDWISYSYTPVFDTDTQKKWDDAHHRYISDKQAFCDKYGCE